MKREFGKKLVTQFFAKWDLTAAVDTSGAYIPGHGTPTVILFLRNQIPATSKVRAVLGIRGEPSTPDDPANGLVWRAILDQIDRPGSQSAFVSVEDRPREMFAAHPWSLSGGGAGDVKAAIEGASASALDALATEIGFMAITGEDDFYVASGSTIARWTIPAAACRGFVEGDRIRDWACSTDQSALFPYEDSATPVRVSEVVRRAWPFRTGLLQRKMFQKTHAERGLEPWEYAICSASKLRTPRSIAFAFIATHNHFVLDRGGKVFNRTAPVIKLKPGATEDDFLALLGVLNSSTAWFLLKDTCFQRGGCPEGKWQERVNINAEPLSRVVLPHGMEQCLSLARECDRVGVDLAASPFEKVGSCFLSLAAFFAAGVDVFADSTILLSSGAFSSPV
jgi:hypothetical protein